MKHAGWLILGLLLVSAQMDVAFNLGPMTVFHNELFLALVVLALPAWRIGMAWIWAVPLLVWLLAHGVSPGPFSEGIKAALRAAQLLLGLALPLLLLRDKTSWQRTAWAAMAALAASSIWAVAQSIAGQGHPLNAGREVEWIHNFQAAAAGMGHHNQLGAALVPGLALAAVLALTTQRRVLALSSAGLMLTALGCSFSRGAWISAGLLGLFLLPLVERRWRYGALLFAAVAVLAALFGPWDFLRNRLGTAFQDSDRIQLWRGLWPYLMERWAWGWGWPQVSELCQNVAQSMNRDLLATRSFGSHAHNFYLQQALAFGVPVLALWGLVGARVIAEAIHAFKRPAGRACSLAFLGSLLGLALQSGTDLLNLHARGLLPALLCGLLLAGARLKNLEEA